MRLGASGYLLKNAEPEEIVEAIVNVHTKGFYFNDDLCDHGQRAVGYKFHAPFALVIEFGVYLLSLINSINWISIIFFCFFVLCLNTCLSHC